MTTIYMTKGLPGSGKSQWAKEQVEKNPGTIRINKDDLRKMLHNGKWSKQNERFTLDSRDSLVKLGIVFKHDVIVDDTNFAPKHEDRLAEIAEEFGAEFKVVDQFLSVPLEECIRRDQERPNYVGEKVIRTMYNQYLKPTTEKIEYDPTLPTAIICDIDGTLAVNVSRSPYDYTKVSEDLVNPVVRGILEKTPIKKIFLSGRDDSCFADTHAWIRKTGLVEFDLHMRKTGDKRKDSIVKQEIFENEIKPHYNISFVLDDRNQVVEMWRSIGLICLQVAEGDY